MAKSETEKKKTKKQKPEAEQAIGEVEQVKADESAAAGKQPKTDEQVGDESQVKADDSVKADKSVQSAEPQRPKIGILPGPNPAGKGPDKGGFYWGTGRRKRSVARVRIRPGSGEMLVNKRKVEDYFPAAQDRQAVCSPIEAVNAHSVFDIFVNVRGGGMTGQAGATMLGVARALKGYNEDYLQKLRDGGYLTRDGRMVERKKPGQRGARRKFQFSKR